MNILDIKAQTKSMIDDLKSICTNYGLGNASSEYKIITEVFLYKFLNDKFIYEAKKAVPRFSEMTAVEVEVAMSKMTEDDYELMLMDFGADTAKLKREHFISHLFNNKNTQDFHKMFDDTLIDIGNFNIDIFSVKTGGQSKIRLFDSLSQFVIEREKKDGFCRAIVDKLANCSFEKVFNQKYDFFADVFEYLVKDYNKDFGKYAEYYTPHSIANIIARIMVPEGAKNVTVYDPAAGSGTLVLALAHQISEENCTIYTQDISQKSNEFLRLNLILNNLVHSLPNVVHDDTLLNPRHLNDKGDGLMTFDYIVSNPPFNTDFSDTRDILAGENYRNRFFAGVPNIPNKDKGSMSVYLMFLQHILYSLDNEKGKAAIVVPTGFLTKPNKIEKEIRKYLIKNKKLRGVISMPSNIFATTGTNVSILFVDCENVNGEIVLMDASKLGTKIKLDGKNQKTVLSPDEMELIIDTFKSAKKVNDFSVVVDYAAIEGKKFSFTAGQYFEGKVEYSELTFNQFEAKLNAHKKTLTQLFQDGHDLEKEIAIAMESMNYDI